MYVLRVTPSSQGCRIIPDKSLRLFPLGVQLEHEPFALPYSQKIWWGIKFGGLVVCLSNRQIKIRQISYSHIYVWRSHTELPNLYPPIHLKMAS